jgi:O-antigen ligase
VSRRAPRTTDSYLRRAIGVLRRIRLDAVWILTVYLILLFIIPSDRTIGGLGAAGSPAVLFGVVALVIWTWYQLSRPVSDAVRVRRPVHIALYLLLATASVSYVVAMLSPRPGIEINAADLGILRLLSGAGILLIASDGIRDSDRLRLLLRRLVFAGSLLATLGIVQFATKQSFVDSITIPGFVTTQDFSAVQDRSGFARAAGTATNPLEYAFVLSMILPFAVTLALDDRTRAGIRRWLPAALIAFALALSGSRSGILGLAVGLLVLFPTWSRSIKIRAAIVAVIGVGAIYVAVPGMVGAVRDLFLDVGSDPSAASRTGSYDIAVSFIERNPLVGRGFGTFLPEYRILDNQWLMSLIELGIIGTTILAGLIVTTIVCVVISRRWHASSLQRQVGQAVFASIASGAVLMAFFDVFSFRLSFGVFFFVIGLGGASWRIGQTTRVRRHEAASAAAMAQAKVSSPEAS